MGLIPCGGTKILQAAAKKHNKTKQTKEKKQTKNPLLSRGPKGKDCPFYLFSYVNYLKKKNLFGYAES